MAVLVVDGQAYAGAKADGHHRFGTHVEFANTDHYRYLVLRCRSLSCQFRLYMPDFIRFSRRSISVASVDASGIMIISLSILVLLADKLCREQHDLVDLLLHLRDEGLHGGSAPCRS